jgi:serine/threonine protein kinase
MKTTFGFQPGDIIADKYEIMNFLGGGWEGEVFRIRELRTHIERSAKIFFPKRNPRNKTAITYAKKLHKLRNCPVLIQYHTIERIQFEESYVTVFISEYVDGELLTNYMKRFRGNYLPVYQGIHLLHALTVGIENIHHQKEYHGDLHLDNIIVERLGLRFDIKLLDLYNLGKANKENLQNDILGIIKIFYDSIGGQRRYSKHSQFVRGICCGLKRTLILKKFKTASQLRMYLETHDWN